MDNLIKFLGAIKKPTVLFTVGLYFIIYEYFKWPKQNLYFYGGIFISIALGSFLEKISKLLTNKYKDFKKQKREKEEYEKLKRYYITEYNNMNSKEKSAIDYCLENKTLMYDSYLFDHIVDFSFIYSLVGKGFGQNIKSGRDFMMNKTCYDILITYKNEKGKSK